MVAGSFRDSVGVERGFFGPLDGRSYSFSANFDPVSGGRIGQTDEPSTPGLGIGVIK